MTQLMENVAEAQEAGNEAYALAEELGKSFVECADEYRKAYCAKRDEQEAAQQAAQTTQGWSVNPAVTLAQMSAETAQLIYKTRTIWNETQAEAY